MSSSLASCSRRCVSATARFSICAVSVYVTLLSRRTTMVNTTAISVRVKPRCRISGADIDEAVVEGLAESLLLEHAVEIGVLGGIEKVADHAVGAGGSSDAAAGEREDRVSVGERRAELGTDVEAVERARAVAHAAGDMVLRDGVVGDLVPVVGEEPVPGVRRRRVDEGMLREDGDRHSHG